MTDRDLQAMIKGLPEEVPSLQWRAGLNERIRAEARGRVRRRWFGFWGAGLATTGFAATLVLSLMVTPRSEGPSVAHPRLAHHSSVPMAANDLFAVHAEAEALAEVSATGPTPIEASLTAREREDAFASGILL
ncbi:MAG: hypothetical protein C4320_02615 [Armatimonadota bacterium]